jgi:hypothetical protein
MIVVYPPGSQVSLRSDHDGAPYINLLHPTRGLANSSRLALVADAFDLSTGPKYCRFRFHTSQREVPCWFSADGCPRDPSEPQIA